MSTNQNHGVLPLKGSLSLIYIFSFLIAIVATIASVTGLLCRTVIYPTQDLIQAFVPNDVVNLLIGLPILLGSMWLAWRGKLVGLLCWTGALFFMSYTYIAYVFAMPSNWAFLLHILLVGSSVYTLTGLVANIDGQSVRQRLSGVVAEKFAGGVLVGLGSLFFLRAMGVVVNAIAGGIGLAASEQAVNIADLLITPSWVIGGFLLWRRKAFGYVIGLGLLFQGSMLFIALIVFLLLQPLLTAAPFALADTLVILVMGLICFVPLALFVRGAMAKPRALSD